MANLEAAVHARKIVEHFGGEWHNDHGLCRCPAHKDNTPSLSVRIGRSAILFTCHAGCDRRDIFEALKNERLTVAGPMSFTPQKQNDYRGLAKQIWENSLPLAGTLGEQYLRSRAICHGSDQLRFSPRAQLGAGADARFYPAIIAAIRDETGLVAIQRTFLDRDTGGKAVGIGKAKRALGLLGSGAIRLSDPTESGFVGLAEGIEDALSVEDLGQVPVWAAGGIERYALIEFPPAVKHVTIFSQWGGPAKTAIINAEPNFKRQGITLDVELPPRRQDWNEYHQSLMERA